jgi:hypothetical protein
VLQIVTFVELEILEELQFGRKYDGSRKFVVEIFPSECHQFLIPLALFEKKLALLQHHMQGGTLLNKVLRNHRTSQYGSRIKVIEVSPLEPETCPQSHWETLVI